jgi:hypothetical protein
MNPGQTKRLFLVAALFNWLVALGLLLDASLLFGLFHVTPAPVASLFLYWFAGLVAVFGLGYFWVSRDPARNRPIVLLGIVGKLSVLLIGVAAVALGAISWQILLLVSVDGVFAVLFWLALKDIQG